MTIDMKLNAVQQAAENSRVALRQKSLSAGGVLADSPKPVIVGVPNGGTVPVALLKSTAAQAGTTTAARQPDLPVTLRVSGWEFPNDRDMVVIEGYPFKQGVDDPDKPEDWVWEVLHTEPAPPVAGRPTEWNVTIPAGKLTDLPATGSVSPTHWKIQSSGALDGNPQYSEIADYFVDIFAPFHNKGDVRLAPPTRLDFPLPLGAKIDTAYLGTIATTGMEFTLPVTDAKWVYKATDKAFIYLSSNLRPSRQLVPTLIVDPVPADGKVSIPASEIGKLQNGTCWLIMAYEDETGNRSLDMLANSRIVEFVPLPVPAPPVVDAASQAGDNTIDIKDAEDAEPTGITVRVFRPLNTQDTDQATVFVEGYETLELVPPVDAFGTNNELVFRMKYTDLKLIYATETGGDPDAREIPLSFKWTWVRGIQTKDSPPATPDLDLSYPGENPDEPSLINRNFAKVQLRGVDNLLNILGPGDLVTDPKVIIPMPTGSAKLPANVVCTWYYNGKPIAEFSPDGLTQFEGELPAAEVVIGGPGEKLTYWSCSFIGGINPQRSLDETVTVTTVRKTVPIPAIDRLYLTTTINCPTVGFVRGNKPPLPSLTFTTAADPVLAGLRSITAHWVGTTNADGTGPISGTDEDVDIPVTGNETTTGIVGSIAEYLTKIVPIQTRPEPFPAPPPPITYASLKYSVEWTDGTKATSDATVKMVSIVNGNREFCHEVR
ncbi:hypothetical protein SAMN04488483_1028 [Pseudomonas helmanticensis]|uniref:Uncharacterized protein n=1 Tax=Pseudomonas helmanticensis TaxID=1471381 RepID=A0ACD2U1S3_9PSED|nr:hypothetical protein [Pseudomonas helmanticensis]SMQ23527.1 hypothetical protein SAMN04488483_1028 [Pseudomonas helmanticensis]